jgi:hypothetical protein
VAEGKKLRKLRKAVNDYLLAQNNQGFHDAPHGDAERCKEAREHLCATVYKLNEAAGEDPDAIP